MPGIVGFITADPDQEAAQSQLSRMLRCMLHDRSYSHGTYVVPEHGCYLAWANHRNSFADCNPIVDRKSGVVLIFSGEHFSHTNGSHANAMSLLRLYEGSGERFVQQLNGWFAGVLVDLKRKSILLFNDRFGVHRIYCHEAEHSFSFASEAKSLLSVHPETRALDTQALGHFLGFGTVFDNRTLFTNISLLPGGSCWSIDRPQGIKKCQYFSPSAWVEQSQLDAKTFYKALRDTLATTLPAYFRSSEPVGLSLTGGLDTRIVMAGMPAQPQPIPTYTYGGIYRDCFDIDVARRVATTCGQSHQVLPLGPDFFRNFETFAEQTVWTTDGTLDLCGTHEIYYSKLARQLSPIRLTGNYGSEVLRSVSNFRYSPPTEALFEPEAVRVTTDSSQSFAGLHADHRVTFAVFKQIPWHLFGRLAAAQSQLVLRSPYMDNELVRLLYQAPPRTRETNETSLRLIADLNPRLAVIPTDMGYGGDVAAPVARFRQVHRYLQFKAEWYYNAGMPQWLARFERTLPLRMFEPLFLGSHKIDHYRLWIKNQLSHYVNAVLSDPASASRPYLNRRGYADLIRAQAGGDRNCLNEVNKVVTLELVHRLLLERDYGK
jgi:asparagine synthase (glutamine-hydrolysing)